MAHKFNSFILKWGTLDQRLNPFKMGVKEKVGVSDYIYRGLWSIEIEDRWNPPVDMHHKTQGKGVHLLSFKTYGLICQYLKTI